MKFCDEVKMKNEKGLRNVNTIEYFSNAYKENKFTPEDVAHEIINKIKNENTIFISSNTKKILEDSKASSKRYREGKQKSKIDGVPVSFKDLFNIKGEITTAGSITLLKNKIEENSEFFNKINEAGAVNIGKTNLSEFAFSGLGLNPHFGTPTIVDNEGLHHAPGGSSSGAAMCVVSNITPVAFGSDTAGSIRIPASFNGLVGFRPSLNRYSTKNVFPLSPLCDTVGTIASNVQDIITIDKIVTNHNSIFLNLHTIVFDLYTLESKFMTQDIAKNIISYADSLKASGYEVRFKKIETFQKVHEWIDEYGWPPAFEAYLFHKKLLESEDSKLIDNRVYKRLLNAKNSDPDLLKNFALARAKFQNALKEELNQLNSKFVITPTAPFVSPLMSELENDDDFAEINLKTLRITMLGSFLGLPGISMPLNVTFNGLFAGALISSLPNNDLELLQLASEIEFCSI